MSMMMGSCALSWYSPGWWWGRAPLAPAATMGGKASPSAPSSRKRRSISQATCRSLMPGINRSATSANTRSVTARARRIASISSGVLTSRWPSTRPSVGTHSTVRPASSAALVRRWYWPKVR